MGLLRPQRCRCPKMPDDLKMPEAERAVAVLYKTVAVLRGLMYSAGSGHATQGEFERILDSTSDDAIKKLVGSETFKHVMRLAETLPAEDHDALLSIKKEPY
jgi:hypothetical protein